jgi:hypothetical protein
MLRKESSTFLIGYVIFYGDQVIWEGDDENLEAMWTEQKAKYLSAQCVHLNR